MGKRALAIVFACLLTAFLGVGAQAQSRNKIRIATGGPSLSYFPIYAAVQKGFFARRGFDVEMIQMNATLTAAALLNHAIDYTIIPSAIATAAARGAPAKVIFFASVKLQHTLVVRPDIGSVTDLAGKRIAATGFGNLLAYEIQFLIDRYKLGPKTTIVTAQSALDRLIAIQKGLADGAIIPAPADLKGEEMGLKRLLQMGTVLQIPQAGLAAIDEKIKIKHGEVIEVLKASIEGLDFTLTQPEEATAIIGKWMALTPAQAAKAYESVKETYSHDGLPTQEQSKAYIAFLAATAGLNPDLPAATIFDFICHRGFPFFAAGQFLALPVPPRRGSIEVRGSKAHSPLQDNPHRHPNVLPQTKPAQYLDLPKL